MLDSTRARIDAHWARRFGAPVPGPTPVIVSATGRHDDAALVLLLGDHALVDAPLRCLDAVAAIALAHEPAALLDPDLWGDLAAGPPLGPADHFWADHATPLPNPGIGEGGLEPIDPAQTAELRGAVDEGEWREAGFDADVHAAFGVRDDGVLVAASVLTTLWGWPADVGVLVAPRARGRGIGTRVAAAACASGVATAGFAAFRVARSNAYSRAVAARLRLEAHGANLLVPLPLSGADGR